MTPIHRRRPGPTTLKELPEHSSDNPLSIHALTVAYHQKPVLWDIEYDAPPEVSSRS